HNAEQYFGAPVDRVMVLLRRARAGAARHAQVTEEAPVFHRCSHAEACARRHNALKRSALPSPGVEPGKNVPGNIRYSSFPPTWTRTRSPSPWGASAFSSWASPDWGTACIPAVTP